MLDLELDSPPNEGMWKDLLDFQNSFFQNLFMMWASTLFQYFYNLPINILAYFESKDVDLHGQNILKIYSHHF